MQRGEVWWADLPELRGSEPGDRRPVLILQANAFNESRIRIVIVAAITSNPRLAAAPGKVQLGRRETNLPSASVVNVSQILTIDRQFFSERLCELSATSMSQVEAGVQLVLSL